MGQIYSRYVFRRKQFNAYLTTIATSMIKNMGGWPPDPAWMRRYGPYFLLVLAIPVITSARSVLSKQFGGKAANNASLDDFVTKELNRRLVSLREIIQEEKDRDERQQAMEDVKQDCSSNFGLDEEDEEDEEDQDERKEEVPSIVSPARSELSETDDSDYVGEYDTEDEDEDGKNGKDTPLKVNDIVSAVNAVTQLDRYAPEVAEGWCLSAKAMARELPEAVIKTERQEEEEWRNGDKLRQLFQRARRLELILDGSSRSLYKRISDPFGGLTKAYIKDSDMHARFHSAAKSFHPALENAEKLLWERDNTQLGKGLRLLWQYKQHIPYFFLGSCLVITEGALRAFPQHYQALLISVITESVMTSSVITENGRRTTLATRTASRAAAVVDVLASLLVSHCLTTLISLLAEKIRSLTNRKIGLKMQVDVYHSILQQDIEYWDVHDTDEAFDTLWASNDCVDDIMRFPNDILQTLSNVVSTSYILYSKNKHLLGIMLILSPAQMIVQHYLGGLDYYISRRAWRKNINSRSDWGEVLDPKNFRTVRSFVREPREVKMFQQELEQETETKATTSALRSLFEPIQSIVAQSSELMGLFYGGNLVMEGTLRAGDLVSFIQTSQNLSYTLRQLMYIKDEFSNSLEPAARVYDLLSHKPKIGLYGGLKPDENKIKGKLTFENIHFAYPSRPDVKVLRGASFEVTGGSMCALVGPSGSGKSTILSLVERFYDPGAGSIYLDGLDIKTLDPCWLRSQMAIVSQEPVLFSVSIRENLIYGCVDEPSQEIIEQACKDANIYDFIVKKCPNKWRTDVGEGGCEISVGQKQRIAIARALLKNPKILLLDEATSALDSESEVLVQKALEKLMQNRTTLVVAHRLSTIRDAGRIVAIKNGAVAEQGTHVELLNQKGLYYSYVKKQRLIQYGQENLMDVSVDGEDALHEAVENELSMHENSSTPSSVIDSDSSDDIRPIHLNMMKYPDMSPVVEVAGSPAFAPSNSITNTTNFRNANAPSPMEDINIGTSAVSTERIMTKTDDSLEDERTGGMTTVFGVVPYSPGATTATSANKILSAPTSPNRTGKENSFISSSAPSTPVGRGRGNGHHRTSSRSSRKKRQRQTSSSRKSNASNNNTDTSMDTKQHRQRRFYRAVQNLQLRLSSEMKQNNNNTTNTTELKSLVEDFGHLVHAYAPISSSKPSSAFKRPHNAKRPITNVFGNGRNGFGMLRSTSTGSNSSSRESLLGMVVGGGSSGIANGITGDSSGYEMDSESDDLVLTTIPLRRTRSYDDR